MDKRQLMERLGLEPHGEGGYFIRTYRSDLQTEVPYDLQLRRLMSSIFYMLTDDSPIGYLHRNRSDIFHFFQGGSPLTYIIVRPDGRLEKAVLGGDLDRGQRLQLLVRGGCWKATELESGEFGLVGEAVSPGFEYGDMELAEATIIRGALSASVGADRQICQTTGSAEEGMKAKMEEEKGILLVHPPVAKGCETPGGPARVAGALRRLGIACRIWDASLEGQLALLGAAARTANSGTAGGAVRSADTGKEGGLRHADGTQRGSGEGAPVRGERGGTWTRRAAGHLAGNLDSLRSRELYGNSDRYRRAMMDVNRLLAAAAKPAGVRLSLADYEDSRLSPVRSADLRQAAAAPETNPFYPWFAERFPEILAENPVSHVGFSLNYLSQALTTFAMIGFLRREYPRLGIVLGGGLVTSWMRGPGGQDRFPGLVDAMVDGPGEGPLSALLGKSHDGGIDPPDFEDFPLEGYLAPGMILPYSASGGCWWRRCSFCPERSEGTPYRPLPTGRVTTDLCDLTARWRPALIHLLDNALSPALLNALTTAPPGAPWYGFARITPELADREFCRRLRAAGCVMLKLGLESGDQRVLDALGKGFAVGMAATVLENLKEAGIATYLYLLFGTPAETPAAARQTLAFTAAHAREIGFLNLAIFNLPAYGDEAGTLATGEFYAGDLSLYRSFTHPAGWNRAEVRRFLDREFKKEPGVAAILRRDPPFFTSNHAPFLAMEGCL